MQASARHGAEERNSATETWLKLSSQRIADQCEPDTVDFVAIGDLRVLRTSDPLAGLRAGGSVCVESGEDPAVLWNKLPLTFRRTVRERNLRLYALNAIGIARNVTGGADRSERMQGIALAGAFFRACSLPNRAAADRSFRDGFTPARHSQDSRR